MGQPPKSSVLLALLSPQPRSGKSLGVETSAYVHFPWCLAKCPYCDFASGAIKRTEVPHQAYADAVLRELERRSPELAGRTLVSVFFGGGTPSLWDAKALGSVLAAIRGAFDNVSSDVEVTVECNPTSLDRAKAAALREEGVNRLSIGVQSLDADRLRFLGRLHDPEGALSAVRDATSEMSRVSGDLMFGMPGQRADDFAREIETLLALGLTHVSAYALTIEEGTQFGALHAKGKLAVAPDEDYADTFLRAREVFGVHGLSQYEVSNYAAPGEEARHNLHYWRGRDYLGLGAGAVGCMSDSDLGARRYKNDPRPERYVEGSRETFEEALTPADRVREALMLGLRTRAGVDLCELRSATGLDVKSGRERAIASRLDRGDVVIEGERLFVPPARWLMLDSIVADLF